MSLSESSTCSWQTLSTLTVRIIQNVQSAKLGDNLPLQASFVKLRKRMMTLYI